MTILAWHGNPDLKADAVARMKKHREADDFLRGEYVLASHAVPGELRGCFHGCLTAEKFAEEAGISVLEIDRDLHTSLWWHKEGERLWGIPRELGARLDGLFEAHDDDATAGEWAVAVTEAIPVGADLSGVVDAFLTTEGFAGDDWALMVHVLSQAPIVGVDR